MPNLCKFRIGARWLFFGEEVRTIVRHAGPEGDFVVLVDAGMQEWTYSRRRLSSYTYFKYLHDVPTAPAAPEVPNAL